LTETARVLLVAAVLSAAAVVGQAWQVLRDEPNSPERLVGELRLERWIAVLLGAVGAVNAGVAVGAPPFPLSNLDAAAGMLLVGLAGLLLQREPGEGLLIGALGCGFHVLWNLAHRPVWVGDDGLWWYRVGSAAYATVLGVMSYWVRRR
jgi:hypothetical protein